MQSNYILMSNPVTAGERPIDVDEGVDPLHAPHSRRQCDNAAWLCGTNTTRCRIANRQASSLWNKGSFESSRHWGRE